ncbi:hypothetical protein CERZMDRAFT_14479, partial [Cercospora zeae-maydis SCOH1-5]
IAMLISRQGPNPQKVAIILEELGLPFNLSIIGSDQQPSQREAPLSGAAPPVQDKNTGMIILNDPNNNITLWESLAVVEYLIHKYDTAEKLHYQPDSQAWWQCQQWLAYQMGAQSPFFSLKAWFSNQHNQKVPTVVDRFADDVLRIVSILEHYLKEGKSDYLVGDKCTYADLVFVPWNNKIDEVMGRAEAWQIEKECPRYRDWHHRLMGRPAVQRVM